MKTTKQIADGLGVNKQQVYRYIKRHNIKEARQENGVMYYDETAESLIIQGFSQKTTSSEAEQKHINETVIDAVISMLQKELDAKNEQISAQQKQLEAKDRQIEQLTAALDHTTSSLQAAQALHAGTMQQQLQAPAEPEVIIEDPQPEKKPGWFTRMFGKKE